jgi:hypothetical protein
VKTRKRPEFFQWEAERRAWALAGGEAEERRLQGSRGYGRVAAEEIRRRERDPYLAMSRSSMWESLCASAMQEQFSS